MKILYVEDDSRDVDLVLRTLSELAPHFQIETAATRREAIERLSRQGEQYDLVLTDIHLPDGDGLTLLSYIREKNLPLPVVVITGAGDEETAVTALKAGADDYITKRGDYIERLPITLEDSLHRFRAQEARRSRPLNVLYAERNKMDAELTIDHFLQYVPYIRLKVVTTGTEVLREVQQSDGKGEYDVILLDYRLPGLNALEVLKELRQNRGFDIPVLLVTGQGNEGVALQAIKLGATNYLVKNPGYLYQLPGELENAYYRAQLVRERLALSESEAWFRLMANSAPVMVWESDDEGLFTFVNKPWLDFTGQTATQAMGNGWAESVHPEDYQRCFDTYMSAFQARQSFTMEYRLRRFDGEYRWIFDNGVPLYSAESVFAGYIGSCVDITERKQAEDALRESETRFLAVIEDMPVGVLLQGPEGEIRICNWAAVNMLGIPEEQLLGKTSFDQEWDIIHEDGSPYPSSTRPVPMALATGKPLYNAVMGIYQSATGERQWQLVNAVPWLGLDGQVEQVLCTFSDITEQKRAIEASRQRDQLLQTMFNSLSSHVVVLDKEGTITYTSKSWEQFAAENQAQMGSALVGVNYLEVCRRSTLNDTYAWEVMTGIERVLGGQSDRFTLEYPCHAPDEQRWYLMQVDSMPREHGGAVISHINITERKQAEEALCESEERYRNVVESQTELICRYLPDTTLTFVNDAYCRYFGKTREKLIGTKFLELIPEPARGDALRHVESLIKNPRVEFNEHEVLLPDGSIGWQQWDDHAILNAAGKIVEFQAIGRDITERRRAEEAQAESEKRYRTLFEKANDAILLETENDEILEVNQRACDLLGYSRKELLAMRVVELQAPEVRGHAGTVIIDELEKHQDTPFETLDLHRSGRRIPVEITNTVVEDRGRKMILSVVRDITERKQLERQRQEQISSIAETETRQYNFARLMGRSPVIREMVEEAEKVAASEVSPILITGETGTGKGLLARAIHYASRRAPFAFVLIDCPSVPETLFESELFGHEQGAFTDAKKSRRGRLELAKGGTLFLDEISEIPLSMQAKLLQVIQEGTFQRLGACEEIALSARIIAATNRDLRAEVAAGRFRADLYQRLFVVQIDIPPLRERKDDITLLADHFIDVCNKKYGKVIRGIAPQAAETLQRYSWPGNVRELEHAIERAVFFEEGREITLKPLKIDLSSIAPSQPKTEVAPTHVPGLAVPAQVPTRGTSLDQMSAAIIKQTVEYCGGNIAKAARQLGISRSRIYRVLEGGKNGS